MKQKIVIKVQMSSESSKSKALKICAEAYGVESVSLEGSEKTRVVVIGEKVDSVKLISSLRNKVANAELISIAEVKSALSSREKEREREKIRREEAAKIEREREREKIRREEAAKKEREREREKMRKEEAAKKEREKMRREEAAKKEKEREREREKMRREESAKKEREREREKEKERKKKETREAKRLINLLKAKLLV